MMNLGRYAVLLLSGAFVLLAACNGASQSTPSTATDRARSSTGSSDDEVVARVGDRTITLEAVDEKVLTTNLQVFQELYNARRQAIEELVADTLIEQAAEARGVTVDELIDEEVTSKLEPVSDEQVQAFFEQNQSRLRGQTLEQIGPQIRDYLASMNEANARRALVDELKEDAGVTVALDPPRVPITVASNERVKGPADAPVTIVEYSDFQ